MQNGDENTKFFQAVVKGRKRNNTIWELAYEAGTRHSSFEGLARLGVKHFNDIYKEQGATSIEEIIHVSQLFPRFAEEDFNVELMTVVSMEELKTVLASF